MSYNANVRAIIQSAIKIGKYMLCECKNCVLMCGGDLLIIARQEVFKKATCLTNQPNSVLWFDLLDFHQMNIADIY